jgi:hypothetical protein
MAAVEYAKQERRTAWKLSGVFAMFGGGVLTAPEVERSWYYLKNVTAGLSVGRLLDVCGAGCTNARFAHPAVTN